MPCEKPCTSTITRSKPTEFSFKRITALKLYPTSAGQSRQSKCQSVDSEGLKYDDSSFHVCPLLRHQEINHKVKTHRNSPSAIRCNTKHVDCGTELLRSKVVSTPSNYHDVKPVTAQPSPKLQDITINHPSSKMCHQWSGDCDLESACTARKPPRSAEDDP